MLIDINDDQVQTYEACRYHVMFFYPPGCHFFFDIRQTFPIKDCNPNQVKIPKHAFAFRFIEIVNIDALIFLKVFNSGGRIELIPDCLSSAVYYYSGNVYDRKGAREKFAHHDWLEVEEILQRASHLIHVGGCYCPFYPEKDVVIPEGSLEELDSSLLRSPRLMI